MIEFFYENTPQLPKETSYKKWLGQVAASEAYQIKAVNYIFCTDEYLYDLNVKYLNHDTYTDIISFDNSVGKNLQGDIFISIDRVEENATIFKVDFEQELLRVMAHGLLHFMGYKDKTEEETSLMRQKEDEKIRMFHVEQL